MSQKLFFIILCSLIAQSVYSQSIPSFKNGDRISFLGNSITEAGFYENYIWLYYLTHFPDRHITIFNNGIGGDTAELMNARFEVDVLSQNPTHVVLSFGMNDSGYFEFWKEDAQQTAQQRIGNSLKHFKNLVVKFKNHPNIRPIIMTSSPFDYTAEIEGSNNFKGKQEAMEEIIAFQKSIANDQKWAFLDIYHPMLAITKREQATDSSYTITGPDRIHPGKPGHLIMAALFLKAQGLANTPISDIEIDANNGKVLKSVNAKVKLKTHSNTSVTYSYKANALPFPIDSVSSMWGNPQKQSEASLVYPFIKEFDQELIVVKNLRPGLYQLNIDNEAITTVSSFSLEKGINIALLSATPQYKQAKNIMHLNDLRAEIENKLRQYYWVQFNFLKPKGLLFNDSQKAFDMANYNKEGFLPTKMGVYQTARFPEIRQMWKNNMSQITNMIYEMNRPEEHLINIHIIPK